MKLLKFFTKDKKTENKQDDFLQKQLAQVLGMLEQSEKIQKEMIIQLDDLSEQISEEEQGEDTLLNSLVLAAKIVEDFYRLEGVDPEIKEQSAMMWRSIKKTLDLSDIEIIDEMGATSTSRHKIEGTLQDETIPEGHISQVLESGYIYKGKIIKPSRVLINR